MARAALAAVTAMALLLAGCGAADTDTSPSTASVPLVSNPSATDDFFESMHDLLLRQGLTEDNASCVTEKLRSSLSRADLDDIESGRSPKGLARKSAVAGTACGTEAVAGAVGSRP